MPQKVTLSNPFYLFFFLQTVGFDSPVQISKGTWTAEDSDEEYFAEKQAQNHHSLGCHLCYHNVGSTPLTQLGELENLDMLKHTSMYYLTNSILHSMITVVGSKAKQITEHCDWF